MARNRVNYSGKGKKNNKEYKAGRYSMDLSLVGMRCVY